MGPRAAVEIVGADQHERVVDHTDLRVHIYGRTVGVLEVIHRDPLAAGLTKDLNGVLAADTVRRTDRASAPFGIARHHRNYVELGVTPERVGERVRSLRRPEVLVLQVYEPARAAKRLEVPRAMLRSPVGANG